MSRNKIWPGMCFGVLTVMYELLEKANGGRRQFLCICECGETPVVTGSDLKTGNTKSCGCVKSRKMRNGLRLKHGHAYSAAISRTYRIWAAMIQRCSKPYAQSYKYYGARGISLCSRWREFANFLADMGEAPDGMSIDRIDNNGNYEPANCRWATLVEQARNNRRNHFITYAGQTRALAEWAEITGLRPLTIAKRILRGWSVEEALNTPSGQERRKAA